MRIRVIPGSEWDRALDVVWARIQDSNPALYSAFFHPEFSRCVASVRSNVEVAIIEDHHGVVGFFPFERKTSSLGEPVGGILSDYHGVISATDVSIDPRDILRKSGLTAWDFSHVPKSQSAFAAFERYEVPSPYMDLSAGYDHYVQRQKGSGSDAIKQTERRERRLIRELGQLRFVADDTSPSALAQVLRWKSEQYIKTGSADLFVESDAGQILQAIFQTKTSGFRGILSTIYAKDELLAGHFGMLSKHHWHYWFPSYGEAYQQYSPGLILLLKMAEHAPTIGIDLIDLGGGTARYKQSLMSHSTSLVGGSVELPSWLSLRRSIQRGSVAMIKASPFAGQARTLINKIRSMSGSGRNFSDQSD